MGPTVESDSLVVERLAAMVRYMLLPVVKLCLNRMSCDALVGLVKKTYIEEARRYLGDSTEGDRRITKSSLGLLCGMDTRAIQTAEMMEIRSVSDISAIGRIIGVWMKDSDFVDPSTGGPRRLLVFGPTGTFQRLVSRAAGRAVTVQTALDALAKADCVSLSDDGSHVELVSSYLAIDADDSIVTLEMTALAMGRLWNASEHNALLKESAPDDSKCPWVQRERWSLTVPATAFPQVHLDLREIIEGQVKVIEEFLEKWENAPGDGPVREIGVGWYSWEADDPISVNSFSRGGHVEKE